jgi:hypothetical protein
MDLPGQGHDAGVVEIELGVDDHGCGAGAAWRHVE